MQNRSLSRNSTRTIALAHATVVALPLATSWSKLGLEGYKAKKIGGDWD